jgi:hypothetical protein
MAIGITVEVACPKCGAKFNYTFVPGMSLSSVRLGGYRYMKCKKCKKFAMFHIYSKLTKGGKLQLSLSAIVAGAALCALAAGLFIVNIGGSQGRLILDVTGVVIGIIGIGFIIGGILAYGKIKKGK